MESNKQVRINLLMLPWLAHGHISPFLHLAKTLCNNTRRNFHIFFCSSPVNLNANKHRIPPQFAESIQLIELQLPSLPDLPPHRHTTKALPLHLMPTLKTAFDLSAPNFSNILEQLRPDLVVYDFLQPWAVEVAAEHNIPAVMFFPSSAAAMAWTVHHCQNLETEFPFKELDIKECFKQGWDRLLEGKANGLKERDRVMQCFERSREIVLIRSFRELEGKFLDYITTELTNKKMVPVGPIVQDVVDDGGQTELLEFLNRKEESSVVFASFGTEYFLSKQEITELANGLELSGANFILVVSFPQDQRTDLENELPEGFLERTKNKGRVVENWAPQAKILAHPSLGAFVSHCGWSSVMEAMTFGVPLVAVPMHLDQPLNARLVEVAGVGVEVQRSGEKCQLKREEIVTAIKEVLVGAKGEEVRRRAKEMSRKMKEKEDEEISGVADHLVSLALQSMKTQTASSPLKYCNGKV